jgi:hypothetical protein
MTRIVDGIFLPLSGSDLSTIYDRLEREGYERSPEGISEFLRDVGAGRLDDEEPRQNPSTPTMNDFAPILEQLGARVAPVALDIFRRMRA